LIAADSSVVIDLLTGSQSNEVSSLKTHLRAATAMLAPVTLTELLSDPKGRDPTHPILTEFILLPITDGYWERAGVLRAKVREAGRKAALGDALIAQACIDADVPLLTRDADFAAFAKLGGLRLA
jgi:predicted nucleic acid-binding protein